MARLRSRGHLFFPRMNCDSSPPNLCYRFHLRSCCPYISRRSALGGSAETSLHRHDARPSWPVLCRTCLCGRRWSSEPRQPVAYHAASSRVAARREHRTQLDNALGAASIWHQRPDVCAAGVSECKLWALAATQLLQQGNQRLHAHVQPLAPSLPARGSRTSVRAVVDLDGDRGNLIAPCMTHRNLPPPPNAAGRG